MNLLCIILAQTNQSQPTSPGGGSFTFIFALMIAMVVFMFLSSRSQKKREQRQRDEMYARMAKNDRVLTIGGVIGTVISVKDNEVVVKVDESTNTKMTFLKTAIQRIVSDDQELDAGKK
jgi:preprotein translocase subunit YajC